MGLQYPWPTISWPRGLHNGGQGAYNALTGHCMHTTWRLPSQSADLSNPTIPVWLYGVWTKVLGERRAPVLRPACLCGCWWPSGPIAAQPVKNDVIVQLLVPICIETCLEEYLTRWLPQIIVCISIIVHLPNGAGTAGERKHDIANSALRTPSS